MKKNMKMATRKRRKWKRKICKIINSNQEGEREIDRIDMTDKREMMW